MTQTPTGLDLERMILTQTLPGWEPSARHLVDILVAGSSSTPKRLSTPSRTRQKIAKPGAIALKGRSNTIRYGCIMVTFRLSCIPFVISLVISPVRTSDEEADGDRYYVHHVPLSQQAVDRDPTLEAFKIMERRVGLPVSTERQMRRFAVA